MSASPAATRGAVVEAGAERLRAAGVEEPVACARLLWARAAHETQADWILRWAEPAPPAAALRFHAWVERHAQGEPLAYLEGRCGFFGLDLWSDSRALVPRADSEAVVECALARVPVGEAAQVADLGTGSGCLILALLHARPRWRGVAVDRSRAALDLARANAARLGLDQRIAFVHGDWLSPLRGPLTLIVANPPYVALGEEVGPGVAEYEPHAALFAPAGDPLANYRSILAGARSALAPGGCVVFEVGAGRADEVSHLGSACGWREVARERDLGGIERAVAFRSAQVC